MGSLNLDGSRISQDRKAVKNIGGSYVFSADRNEVEVLIAKTVELGTGADETTSQYSIIYGGEQIKVNSSLEDILVNRAIATGVADMSNGAAASVGGGGGSQNLESVLAQGNTGSGIILDALTVTNIVTMDPNSLTETAIFHDTVTFDDAINVNGDIALAASSRISLRGNALGLQANSDGVLSLFDSGSNLRPLAAAKYLEVVTIASGSSIELASQSGQVIVVKGTGPRTVNLQPLNLWPGCIFDIKDGDGTASSGNITVDGNGANIDGSSTFTLDINYASYTFVYNGTEWNLI